MTRGIVGQQECSVKQQRGKFGDCIISVRVALVDLCTLKKKDTIIVIILDFFLIRKIYCDPNICSYVLWLGLFK